MSRRGIVLFAAMCLIWGLPYLLIRVAVAHLTPVTLVFFRTAIGAVVLVPVAVARGELKAVLARWPALLLYTAVEIAVPWVLLSDAERRLPSSLSSLFVATVPIVGMVLAWALGQERPGARQASGLFAGLAGVAVLAGLATPARNFGAVAEVAVVVLGYAYGPLVVARRLADLPRLGVVAASLAACALAYAPFALRELPPSFPPATIAVSVGTLGVLCTAAAFVLFFALIAEVGPVRATVITYVNPAVAVALGVLVLGESFTVTTAAGFALILAGAYLAMHRGPVAAGAARLTEEGG